MEIKFQVENKFTLFQILLKFNNISLDILFIMWKWNK